MIKYSLLDLIDGPMDLKMLTTDDMNQLSEEIRAFILDSVSNTGGHLASNLGVVELTLSLHYVFSSPKDKLIWDVGHQSYVHKILTGRKGMFDSLRQLGGLSGFPKPEESEHDIFGTGHSSTAISAALGMSRARDIRDCGKYHVVAIVGDGALTGGMGFEALNDAGHSKTNLIVILNDNEMSISHNVGALAVHLSKVRSSSRYNWFKKGIERMLDRIPWIGKPVSKSIELVKRGFKSLLVHGMIFEEMGFKYLGPIDGHNINSLVNVLGRAKKMDGPILIHIITQKGKGYEYAEKDPEFFHGVPPFTTETGRTKSMAHETFSWAFGNKLAELAGKDDRVVAITAAMPESTGLLKFRDRFPNRFFDVGIAEQHAVTMAAGLANSGLKPYVAVYSTFLQRAYDQVLHDVCIQNLPVRFGIDRAGLVGEDGETHQGVFDISYLNHIPNLTIFAPKDTQELRDMMDFSLHYERPMAIRYPKGYVNYSVAPYFKAEMPFNPFDWELLIQGRDCCILSFGKMLGVAVETADLLAKQGIHAQVVNARCIKPLDNNMLKSITLSHNRWITLEDNVITGGFGSSVVNYIADKGLDIDILNLGIPDAFVPQGKIEQLMSILHLDPGSIANRVSDFLNGIKENVYVHNFKTKA
ncbi:MAG TPA: 1-deoxy-D-xylulose-5-phosphate synthase [Clostridia bacterium]|nr:1-deoxy-D-xylulose-5-phosphate synthase [Clostridia bacterium]